MTEDDRLRAARAADAETTRRLHEALEAELARSPSPAVERLADIVKYQANQIDSLIKSVLMLREAVQAIGRNQSKAAERTREIIERLHEEGGRDDPYGLFGGPDDA